MSGFPRVLLADLRCPYCGSRFETALELAASNDGLRDGVLRCDCYEYPVVQGIPVLRQISPVSSTRNGAVERLREDDADAALQWLLAAGSAPGVPEPMDFLRSLGGANPFIRKLRNVVRNALAPSSARSMLQLEHFKAALAVLRPRGYADYLLHRFANPSFLGAIPPLIALGDACARGSRRRLLDLMCGVGHSSATIRALCPDLDVVMCDVDFVNLFIARRFVAPDAAALCLDMELPIPMSDASVDAVFCLDGLHYVRSKVALLKEVDRLVAADGSWLFAHMHNSAGANINPGAPLDAPGYSRRFSFGEQRLLPETEILRQFRENGSLDLARQPPTAALESSHALTLVGGRTDKLWHMHSGLDTALARNPGLLEFNPLYGLEEMPDELLGRATWPSDSLRRECSSATPLFGESIRIDSRTLSSIASARAGGGLSDEVRDLLRSFVLVPLPACYPRIEVRPAESVA